MPVLQDSTWYEYILQPEIVWAVIAMAGILSYTITSVIRLHHRHQERLAMIDRGMNPDQDDESRASRSS